MSRRFTGRAAAGGLKDGKFFVRVYFTRDAGNLDLTFSDGRVSGLLRIMRGCPLESNPGGDEIKN